MGGLIALLLAEKYAKKIKAFINIEGNLKSEDCSISRNLLSINNEALLNGIFRNYKFMMQLSKNRGLKRYAEELRKYEPQKSMYDYSPSLVEYSDHGNLIERFASLKIPKSFIHGSENSRLSYITELKQKGVSVFEIADSNHFPQYDNPEEYYQYISSFVEMV